MASLPPSFQVADASSPAADDITDLRKALQMPELPYVDITTQNAVRDVLKRWPLLSELSYFAEQNTP
ncbi:cellulose biosynthesis protein BcsR [Azomonas agilis]|uniref:Cellulose biosynthesis protein BcsR n=1 Tax=Azomonas agilis TaxID=116849 RepID=A0A562I166_9GAMM|nr:cellulose biosynthesis protein BcsR [Azomonas agilis]TWH64408.1 cellulose biosynthesis protein BcsR [Azomonas agilis]